MADPFVEIGQQVVYAAHRMGERVCKYGDGPWLHGGDTGEVIEYHADSWGDPEDDYATVLLTARDGRTQRLAISPDYQQQHWLVEEIPPPLQGR